MGATQGPAPEVSGLTYFKRGDRAVLPGGDLADDEAVTVVMGRNIEVGVRETARTERWLLVDFDGGGRLLVHPSALSALIAVTP